MSAKTTVPDAWEDDWETQADRQLEAPREENLLPSGKISKAERRARQAELNKKLWEEAEAPKNFHFLEARNDVPLKSEFKPAVKVLSRKPAPKVVARNDPVSGLEQLTFEDDEEESEDDAKKNTLSLEARKEKAQREREEKQRKYEEVRERLFGASGTGSGTSSPGNVTPPKGGESKSRPKNKGGRDGRPSSSAGNKARQLYDPSYRVKPDSVYIQKRETQLPPELDQAIRKEEQPVRAPRGPDGSGRGGFGFAARGGSVT
ncbi:MAG: hypothetical protein M1830_010578 [Pleopsidium flavum]|nr:MAG: hypothetical protein M1830_010578 [Pleopsidium flavum]